jgi:hypothetical protein
MIINTGNEYNLIVGINMYSCRSCSKLNFTIDEMKKEKYLTSNRRGICKCCATEYERNRQLNKKANNQPTEYLSCDSCDRTFSNRHTGNYSGNNQYIKNNRASRILRIQCPFCKSEEIERY